MKTSTALAITGLALLGGASATEILGSTSGEMITLPSFVTVTYRPEHCDDAAKAAENKYSEKGDQLFMHYTGWIDESSATGNPGEKFDSSRDRDSPLDFPLGEGRVIPGWDQGLIGMCIGEKRELILPPDVGYGDSGAGEAIPGGATLKFETECVDIKEGENLFKDIDTDANGKITKEEVSEWFTNVAGRDMPDELWEKEDANGDGHISWEEFGGPKGKKPVHEEL
eukprot:CAMPEP_0197847458 /NCGR_PEP_ID=MMETSP1438-20131217/6303_1 /TAXON_ID=1461541 /ORGANISM="Pterosperma sp., Strain CCMP1384" /LENGTH=225 /DNA_ID=CAMNT_0043459389 /DNA_START=56 /DNA_END=733 /DNA_ORIENTATION=+